MIDGQLHDKNDMEDDACQSVKLDLKTSVIKPLHAKWAIKCHEKLENETEFIKRAFEAVGIN